MLSAIARIFGGSVPAVSQWVERKGYAERVGMLSGSPALLVGQGPDKPNVDRLVGMLSGSPALLVVDWPSKFYGGLW